MASFQDLTGQTFGRLTVISRAETRGGLTCWLCRCECGSETTVRARYLLTGHTKSCGCYQRDAMRERGRRSKGVRRGPQRRNRLTEISQNISPSPAPVRREDNTPATKAAAYSPPRVQIGEEIQCEIRGLVTVVDWSDRPGIMWPRCGPPRGTRGRRGLIVSGDLTRALRTETQQAVMDIWGVSQITVSRWKVAIGAPHTTDGTRAAHSINCLGKWAAGKMPTTGESLARWRAENPGANTRPDAWRPEEMELLRSTTPAAVVAQMLGRTLDAVYLKRERLGPSLRREARVCRSCGHGWTSSIDPVCCSRCRTKAWAKCRCPICRRHRDDQHIDQHLHAVGFEVLPGKHLILSIRGITGEWMACERCWALRPIEDFWASGGEGFRRTICATCASAVQRERRGQRRA